MTPSVMSGRARVVGPTFQSGLIPVWGQWNFVALVIDPTKGTVYLDKGDGTGLQSAVFTPPQGNKTVIWDSPNIGVDLGYDRWFNGSIDEVVVYDRALSPAEIANLDLLGTTSPWTCPAIIAQPTSVTVYAGQSAGFDSGRSWRAAVGVSVATCRDEPAGRNQPHVDDSQRVLYRRGELQGGDHQQHRFVEQCCGDIDGARAAQRSPT